MKALYKCRENSFVSSSVLSRVSASKTICFILPPLLPFKCTVWPVAYMLFIYLLFFCEPKIWGNCFGKLNLSHSQELLRSLQEYFEWRIETTKMAWQLARENKLSRSLGSQNQEEKQGGLPMKQAVLCECWLISMGHTLSPVHPFMMSHGYHGDMIDRGPISTRFLLAFGQHRARPVSWDMAFSPTERDSMKTYYKNCCTGSLQSIINFFNLTYF